MISSMSRSQHTIVDPKVRDARERFERMMSTLRQMGDAEYRAFGIKAGFLNADGSPKLPEGDPCVTAVG
jgi:hypothetical protein